MDLQSFIAQSLIHISDGIQSANDTLAPKRKKSDGTELPKLYLLSPGTSQGHGHGVHFDIAVTTEKIADKSGGAKFKLAVLTAELEGKNKHLDKTISRIQFSVTVNQWHG